jgi:hypothetical protein
MTRRLLLVTVMAASVATASSASAPTNPLLDQLEAQLTREPASLSLGAEYRELVIETGRYDRSIKLFERLSKDPRGGANRFLNLALAEVDKVPVSGVIRQALLGRDAIDATTRAIAIEPTDVAYLIRGLVNLFYDRAISPHRQRGRGSRASASAVGGPSAQAARGAHFFGARRWVLALESDRQGARNVARRSRPVSRRGRLSHPARRC